MTQPAFSLPVHSLERGKREAQLFWAVADVFAQAVRQPMREQIDQVRHSQNGSPRAALFFSALYSLPSALWHPTTLPVIGAFMLAAIMPETKKQKANFSDQLSAEFGQLLASAWISNLGKSVAAGRPITPDLVRPILSKGPSQAWADLVGNVKSYGLSPLTVDAVLCDGLRQLSQNDKNIYLPLNLVLDHTTVKSALAKSVVPR